MKGSSHGSALMLSVHEWNRFNVPRWTAVEGYVGTRAQRLDTSCNTIFHLIHPTQEVQECSEDLEGSS